MILGASPLTRLALCELQDGCTVSGVLAANDLDAFMPGKRLPFQVQVFDDRPFGHPIVPASDDAIHKMGLRRRMPLQTPVDPIIERLIAPWNDESIHRQSQGPKRAIPETASHDDGAFRWKAYADARGMYRIAAPAVYRIYRRQNTPPVAGVTAVWTTSATLPYTPTDTFADGIWYVGVTWFNGYLESGFLSVKRLTVSGGADVGAPPEGPAYLRVVQRAGGVVRVEAGYNRAADAALDGAGDTWAIWYTTNGVDPDPSNPADDTEAMSFIFGESCILAYDLPAQAHGTDVRAIARVRRTTPAADSENVTVVSTTADATGPSAPEDAESWPGLLPEGL